MISKFLIASTLLAIASASCPNDCSQHGVCNQFSACVCYRNWMGADCSERVCPFGHAFIDTPQGDLNADGRVDRANVKVFTIVTNVVYGAETTFPANVMIFPDTEDGNTPNDLKAYGTSVASAISTESSANTYQWSIPVVVHDNSDPDLTSGNLATKCAAVTDVDGAVVRGCDLILGIGDGSQTVEITANTLDSYTYQTQFTNSKTWELYPVNHGKGKPSTTLTKYWDEAHFYAECSGKGTCNRDSGECECYPGFTGAGCARTSCPNECSGHGVCSRLTDLQSTYKAWDRNKTQACVCDAGYQGIDCSQRVCPSGDDPITRNSEPAEGASVEYVNSPHTGGQEAQIQTFGRLFAPTASVCSDGASPDRETCENAGNVWTTYGTFALEFTDEFGDKWVTQTLEWDASAADVENALEALPNSVIQDVIVHDSTDDIVYSSSLTAFNGQFKSWTVTFITNSGDIPSLGVRYSWAGTINSLAKTENDNAGQFRTLARCGVSNDGCVDVDSADTHTNDVMATAIGVCSFRTCTGGSSEPSVYSGDASDEQYLLMVTDTVQSDVDAIKVVFHTTGRPGSQENAVCSNRGLCDYSSGLCKCFNGFTDDDCSRQNALAMY